MWSGYWLHEYLATKALQLRHSPRCVFLIVYSALFVDNILLTAAVPVLPDFLRQIEDANDDDAELVSEPATSLKEAKALLVNGSFGLNRISDSVLEAHGANAAYIFAIKAFIQLLATPFVGIIVSRQGHRRVLAWAVYLLFASCLVLCWAKAVWSIVASKFLHGIASAGVAISGLSSIAESYSDDEALRTKVIGRSMGAVALGVLVGYPFGGITYDLLGKDAVFEGILLMILPVVGIVLLSSYNAVDDYEKFEEDTETVSVNGVMGMLSEPVVIIATGATFLSSASIAILEPTLPIWLIYKFDPPRWKIGTVFLPDSIGYFIGTHFFTHVTRHLSRSMSIFSAILFIGVALFFIPHVSGLLQLIVPHFIIGLGVGCTDVSVLSLLASFGDIWYQEWCYSMIYALNQAAVCVAYSLGPAWAGLSVSHFGFSSTMTALALVNVLYAPLTLTLRSSEKALSRWPAENQTASPRVEPMQTILELSVHRMEDSAEEE